MVSSEKNSEAQIEIARLKAVDERRLQEGQLTAQLVEHLTSKDVAQRAIAIIALRATVPPEVCDKIISTLAQEDGSPVVRERAIEELGLSSTIKAARALADITHDPDALRSERQLAAVSSVQVAVRQVADGTSASGTTLLLGSSRADELALDSGPFTQTFLKGITGDADSNGDGGILSSELGRYIATNASINSGLGSSRQQQPIWLTKGERDFVIGPLLELKKQYRKVSAVLVGVSDGSGIRLPGVRADLQRVSDTMRQWNIPATVLADRAATKSAVIKAFNDAATSLAAGDLFFFYFAGTGIAGKDGTVRWWLAGGQSDALTASDINSLLDSIPAKSKVVVIDSCHAGAIALEDGLTSR